MHSEKVVIIGSGCAGLSAAIYTARAQLNPLVISGDLPGGLLTQTTEIENFPGFPEKIQGMELMDRMRQQAEKFGARFKDGTVQQVELVGKQKQLALSNGEKLLADAVIFAVGSHPSSLNLPLERELLGGKGISVCATCDGFFYRNEIVCIVGGGDSACEEALYLSKLCKKVYLIHRRDTLRASKIMADRVCSNENIEVVWNHAPEKFEVDENGFLKAFVVKHTQENTNRTIDCKGVFLAIGWKPNTQAFNDILDLDEQGYIKITKRNVCTSIPGIFAAGDCVDRFYRQAAVAAGMGIQAALEAESWLIKGDE